MKQYRMFRGLSGDNSTMLQSPDNPDALAEGETLSEALKFMRIIEKNMGLEPLLDQAANEALIERATSNGD